jgi:hypothetical protein
VPAHLAHDGLDLGEFGHGATSLGATPGRDKPYGRRARPGP